MYYVQSLITEDTSQAMASLSVSMPSATTSTSNSISNLNESSSSSSSPSPTVKPCCVCKEEKATRDECMLFSNSNDPQKDCATTIDKYRSCMEGFGFKLP